MLRQVLWDIGGDKERGGIYKKKKKKTSPPAPRQIGLMTQIWQGVTSQGDDYFKREKKSKNTRNISSRQVMFQQCNAEYGFLAFSSKCRISFFLFRVFDRVPLTSSKTHCPSHYRCPLNL